MIDGFAYWLATDRALRRWLFKAVVGALIALSAFHQRHAISNHFMEMRLDAVSQFQQRIVPSPAAPPAPAPVRTPAQIEAERAAAKRRAEEHAADQAEQIRARQAEERKEQAWQSFFQQERSCLQPESQHRIQVCRARENRLRQEFDKRWARASQDLT